MSFTAWTHSHARSILFLLGAFALAGALASFSLPVSLFPQVSFPRVRITLDAGDRERNEQKQDGTRMAVRPRGEANFFISTAMPSSSS